MQEVFFRLKDKEDTWETMAGQFSRGTTNVNPRQNAIPAAQIEAPLLAALLEAGPGVVIRPLKLNSDTVVVAELERIEASFFDEELRRLILNKNSKVGLEKNAARCSANFRYRRDAIHGNSGTATTIGQRFSPRGCSRHQPRLLARASEEVRLSQGQTLLRGGVIETHAFLLLEGTLRLLGRDPVRNELFTVGRCSRVNWWSDRSTATVSLRGDSSPTLPAVKPAAEVILDLQR